MSPIYLVDFSALKFPSYSRPARFHIDLGKIVSISDPQHIDRMSGGDYIVFSIIVQLRDDPLHVEMSVMHSGIAHLGDAGYKAARKAHIELAILEMDKIVNKLISEWEAFRAWETSR